MIANLKPYSKYKESGLPWLGQSPDHWTARRMKFLFKQRAQKGFPNEPLLAATQSKGVVRKEDYGQRTVTATTGLENLKLVEVGDFVISLRSFQGGIEFSNARGIISPAYTVLRPSAGIESRFFKHYFKSIDFIRSLTLYVTGIREGQNVDYERLSRAFLPLPPPDEQAAIVRFLDWANRRLERAIQAKRKAITLLNEQKQSIIHRAVTRGLDPSVPFKPSFVVGVGDIPKHWEERRLRTLTKEAITNGVGESAQVFREDWPRYVRITDIGNTFTLRDSTRASLPPSLAEGAVLRAGDLLIAAVGATFGKAYVHTQNEEACFAGYLVRVRLGQMLNPLFAGYWTESQHYWTQLRANVIQSTIQNFSAARVKRLLAVVPPIAEQASIVAFVSEETSDLNILVSRLEDEIELLREYRTRLVADVVTGKLDVREAAAQLPDEVLLGTIEDAADLGEDLGIADEEATA